MNPPLNLLITSLSRKVPLIREVRKALKKISPAGKVFGADSNPDCIGKYFVDEFWQMPPTDRLDPAGVIRYCRANAIKAIIPTRDGELLFFAESRDIFRGNGIEVMISSPESVHICLDKLQLYRTLKKYHGINPIVTDLNPDPNRKERWVVKERYGSGAKNIRLDISLKAACACADNFEAPVFQPYINGREYSIDLFISKTGIAKGCVVRTRDIVIQGESQVTTTLRHLDIENICLKAAAAMDLTGHVLFQIIEDNSGRLHLVECNCRFGGASTLSIAAGLDSFYWFLLECVNEDLSNLPFLSYRQGLRQIRYAEDYFVQREIP